MWVQHIQTLDQLTLLLHTADQCYSTDMDTVTVTQLLCVLVTHYHSTLELLSTGRQKKIFRLQPTRQQNLI